MPEAHRQRGAVRHRVGWAPAERSGGAQAGAADAPTEVMYAEVQELLQLFGLPYIVAPTEAEAQCAWLDAQVPPAPARSCHPFDSLTGDE